MEISIDTTALLNSELNFALCYALATELLYSTRAPPAPTPSVEPSPPTEMSTGGRISEQVARACRQTIALCLYRTRGQDMVHIPS